MKAIVSMFALSGVLFLLAGMDQAMQRPAKAAPVHLVGTARGFSAPTPEVFNRQVGGPALDKVAFAPVTHRRPAIYPRPWPATGCNSCQQNYACNSGYGYGGGGPVFYGWNGNGFPVARFGLRVASAPFRWVANGGWFPGRGVLRCLFGRC